MPRCQGEESNLPCPLTLFRATIGMSPYQATTLTDLRTLLAKKGMRLVGFKPTYPPLPRASRPCARLCVSAFRLIPLGRFSAISLTPMEDQGIEPRPSPSPRPSERLTLPVPRCPYPPSARRRLFPTPGKKERRRRALLSSDPSPDGSYMRGSPFFGQLPARAFPGARVPVYSTDRRPASSSGCSFLSTGFFFLRSPPASRSLNAASHVGPEYHFLP